MIIPPSLQSGDKIGFFSPSSSATSWAPKRFERAKKFLKSKGYGLVSGNLTGKNDFYRSGSIQERADELNALIRDKEVRCIMSTIGGANSNSILPYLDYEALRNDPKIIIGYSDVTAILLAIYSKIGLVTFYGPALVASFGEIGHFVEATFKYFQSAVVSPMIKAPIPNPKEWTDEFIDWEKQSSVKKGNLNELVTVNSGVVSGRLIVGNLNTISGIYGSAFMPPIEHGDILVVEDSLKNPAVIERSFAHLKLNGIFDTIGGLVLGKHEKFDDLGTKRKPYEILQEVMGEISIPVLAEYDCAHTHPMTTLPIGVKATLDATKQSITLLENPVKG